MIVMDFNLLNKIEVHESIWINNWGGWEEGEDVPYRNVN